MIGSTRPFTKPALDDLSTLAPGAIARFADLAAMERVLLVEYAGERVRERHLGYDGVMREVGLGLGVAQGVCECIYVCTCVCVVVGWAGIQGMSYRNCC